MDVRYDIAATSLALSKNLCISIFMGVSSGVYFHTAIDIRLLHVYNRGTSVSHKNMTKNKTLTKRQSDILEFLKGFIVENGYPPALREIAAYFRIASHKNVAKHLDALDKKGFIRRGKRISRAIEVIDHAAAKDTFLVPILGQVRAGVPHQAVEDISGHVALDSRFFRCKDAFLLKVAGKSMSGAGIEDGDHVLVSRQSHAQNNDIVVALLGDSASVKRFFFDGKTVTLRPENPDFEPVIVKSSQEFSIIGKVVSVIKHT